MSDWQQFFSDVREGRIMPLPDMNLNEIAARGATAGGLGLIGRLVALSVAAKRPTGWSLLWELPLAMGMGIIGKGVAELLDTSGFVHYAVVIAVSYTGPRAIDILTQRYLDKTLPKRESTKSDPAKTPKKE